MAEQTNQTPRADQVLDELLGAVHDALDLARAVIRGEEVVRGGGAPGTDRPSISDRLETARHIVEFAAPLAERLHTVQSARPGGGRGF